LISLLAGLIGGRALFAAVNWDYFQIHPAEIWQWRQGISYYGALAGGLAAFCLWARLWARWAKRDWAAYADLYAPGLALAALFVWLACLLDGTAYGRETIISLWSADLPDKLGVSAVRYQTQLMGAVWSLLWAGVVWGWRGRLRGGRLFWLALAGVTMGRLLVSFLRGDSAPMLGVPMLGEWRLDALADGAALLLIAFALKNPAWFRRSL
jgi:prolipoprotein diacylglyceryltransferase